MLQGLRRNDQPAGRTTLAPQPQVLADRVALDAVVVEAAGQRFAVPTAAVEGVAPLSAREAFRQPEGTNLPMIRLAELWGVTDRPGEAESEEAVLVVTASGQRVGLVVDRLLNPRQTLYVPPNGRKACVAWVSGTGVDRAGGRAAVLDAGALVRHGRDVSEEPGVVAAATVLIADDCSNSRQALARLVSELGFLPLLAKEGVEVLEVLSQVPQTPTLLLLDSELPRMNGSELLAVLRAQGALRNVPVVLVTSIASEITALTEQGASAALLRPFRKETLASIIRVLAGHRKYQGNHGDDSHS